MTPQKIETVTAKATYTVPVYEVIDGGFQETFEPLTFCKGDKSNPDIYRQKGYFTETLIAVAKRYLEENNVGEMATRETSMAITKLDEALLWIGKRASDRAARGVQGTYQK